jgi:hypothetical protein
VTLARTEDRLLLRSVLTGGPTAVSAGLEWIACTDLDALAFDQQRVLPLLYRALSDAGVSDLPPRLKGVYRHSWARNTVRARVLVEVTRRLAALAIPSLVVKGMALVEYYGDRWAARDMYDADLLVPTPDASRAVAELIDAGWAPSAGATSATVLRRLVPARAGWSFGYDDNQIDLHWHLFNTSLGVRSDDDVWDAAETFVLDRERFLRPHPADLVLHACEQGAVDAGGAQLVCAIDIATIVGRVGGDVIGPRLAEQARRHSLVGRAREFLEFVTDVTDSSELDALSRRLATTRSGLVERGIVGAARGTCDGRRLDLWSSARRHAGGRTGLAAILRGMVRERVEPRLQRRWLAAAVYVASGRSARVGRLLRRFGGSWISTPAGESPPLRPGEWIDFSDESIVDRYGGPGWSYSDADGTWTDGTEARVVLPVHATAGADLALTLDLMPYLVPTSSARRVDVRIDDRHVARLSFDLRTYTPEPIVVDVVSKQRASSGPLELGLVIRRPAVPASLGLSSDARRVGLKLRRLRLDPGEH